MGDRHLYQCDKCGLQLSLINARGDDCPRCSGHFKPIHPLAINPGAKHFDIRRAICDIPECGKPAVVMYRELSSQTVLRVRCDEHERDEHIMWDEQTIKREQEKLVRDIETRLHAEIEMDKYT